MNRAYLALDEVSDREGRMVKPEGDHLTVLASLKNYGDTPAYDVKIHARIEGSKPAGQLSADGKDCWELYPTQERIIIVKSDGAVPTHDGSDTVRYVIHYKSGVGNVHFTEGTFRIDGYSWFHESSNADWIPE